MRDWYRGPWSLNQARTSRSTRSEIGCFGTGSTTTAWVQKSAGRSASSRGEVRRISRSVTRRSFARSARPRTALSGATGRFDRRLVLMAITQTGRNESSDNLAGFGPIRVHNGKRDTLGEPDGHNATFCAVPAVVLAFERGAFEDQPGELEIDATVAEVPRTLPFIPTEPHNESIRLYIRRVNMTDSLTTSCSQRPRRA